MDFSGNLLPMFNSAGIPIGEKRIIVFDKHFASKHASYFCSFWFDFRKSLAAIRMKSSSSARHLSHFFT